MSEAGDNVGSMDFSKMKVNDLKKLLKSRGLSVTGVKQDLIERLQTSEAVAGKEEALLEGSEVGEEDTFDEELDKELDESALMAEEEHTHDVAANESKDKQEQMENEESKQKEEIVSKPSAPKTTEESKDLSSSADQNGASEVDNEASKQIKVNLKSQPAALSEADKMKARAERFGTSEKNQPSALANRTERFSVSKESTSKPADSSTGQAKVTSTTTNEQLKRRAARFGILSPAEVKRQHLEKLQARKLRFQQTSTVSVSTTKSEVKGNNSSTIPTTTTKTTNGNKITTSLTPEERKRLRTERFKTTT